MTLNEWRPLHYAAVIALAAVWLVATFGYSVAHPASNEITGTPRPTDGPTPSATGGATATMTPTASATARPTAVAPTPTPGYVYLPVVMREGTLRPTPK